MYIILSGSVAVYIKSNNDVVEDIVKEMKPNVTEQNSQDSISNTPENSNLGNLINTIGRGGAFGEIALLRSDCFRTASILTESACELVVIHRDLYKRSISDIYRKHVQEKFDIIKQHDFFKNWLMRDLNDISPRIQKLDIQFGENLIKQGQQFTYIYLIVSGEVIISVNAKKHEKQYQKFLKKHFSSEQERTNLFSNLHKVKKTLINSFENNIKPNNNTLSLTNSLKTSISLITIGKNQIIGDIELVLELDTYHISAKCTQPVTVLAIEKTNLLEKLKYKRYPINLKCRFQRNSVEIYTTSWVLKLIFYTAR
ncbi:hypothetical protein A3Q56_06655 [Intoshia linei]|uniref:Cyclic nucleotide-binding domain-containing protein n=1 Tax=Intoshia linei TaxID=1819745 RepID=A0A177AVU7_9BILA|nr:hypothetical protein A3Q56_06655 [Intoshia linei]